MHIVHLSCFQDLLVAVLLDWTDTDRLFQGSRDVRLQQLWLNYRGWCEAGALKDRASRKLFLLPTLKPTGKYAEVSQKILSATAARYMTFWLASGAERGCAARRG